MGALVLIIIGSSIYYFFGYKDSFWIEASSYLPVIFGWLCVLYPLALVHISIRNKQQRSSVIRKAAYALYLGWLVALVAGFIELDVLLDKRVENILASDKVGFSKARVVRIEQRRLKASSHTYAVIEYNAGGEQIKQAIRDENGLYRPGQEIDIKYAQKYPDMFAVVVRDYYELRR